MRAWSVLLFTAAISVIGVPAQASWLVAEPRQGQKIRIDGDLREWPAKMATLDEKISGPAVAAKVVVGYDDDNVYLALRVADKRIARTKAGGEAEDHATLRLAFPRGGGGYATYEIDVYPGRLRIPALVRVNGRAATGAKAVENPAETGLLLEAKIPWATFPEAARTRVGLRATVSYTNADRPGAVSSVVATGRGSAGRELGALLLEAEQGLGALLKDRGLSDVPTREAYGDLCGDDWIERVAVFGRFLTISGPKFRQGKEVYFSELVGLSGPSMLRELGLVDFDGDGKSELYLRRRIGSREKYREVLEVYRLGGDDTPTPVFAHEVGLKTSDGEIANEVKITARAISISRGRSKGFEAESYEEPLPPDMPSTILPWESNDKHTFRWQGGKIAEVGGAPRSFTLPRKASGGSTAGASSGGGSRPPPPRPPNADELLDRLYSLYRKERGVGRSKPRFDFVTDVAGDASPERVLVHDKDLLVFGKGFRGGTSYSFITIGVESSKDILRATSRDVTGDGKAEILVYAVLRAKASKALGGDVVARHALLVYSIRSDAVARIFAAETGRALGDNQILGVVAFHPRGDKLDIELGPGRAIGWTEQTYPFPPDTTAAGGLEPLLLPWTSERRRYAFDGSAFARE